MSLVPREQPPEGPETAEARLRRIRMRAGHRGIREMDLVLGGFARKHLEALEPDMLDTFDALLSENDHDIYTWVAGAAPAPAPYAVLIARIAADVAADPAGDVA